MINYLEICKRIAEIEGVEYSIETNDNGYVWLKTESMKFSVMYDPLTDDALCFQLMVKYKVKFYSNKDYFVAGLINKNGEPHCFNMDESPNKVICLTIIEAHKND